MKYCSASIFGILAATFAASHAWAGERVFAGFGQTITLNGTVEHSVSGEADPFTLQVYGNANECLRIAVLAEDADLKATLVGPSGRAWQNDDGGVVPCPLCPIIKAIIPSGPAGWHTLTVSHFSGQLVEANFEFQISRFATTDSRCNPPTTPIAWRNQNPYPSN